ncbi:MAG TPA: hypothetical protein VHS06_05335 [Chloroflexota bacterium]|nr:hypothetical protein [Chloroflexota bacterium]
MAGKIKVMIDRIIQERSKGNPTLASVTTTKLILKGINPASYGPTSADDPAVMQKLESLARELGLSNIRL